MKKKKLKLNELSKTELNEREMCRILGGAGACQCGCHYEGKPGGSSTASNNSANNADDLTSDPTPTPTPIPEITLGNLCDGSGIAVDNLCPPPPIVPPIGGW